MAALLIFTTILSIGTLVLCFYTDLSHEKEGRAMLKLIRQLEQRIKKLEEDKNHEKRN